MPAESTAEAVLFGAPSAATASIVIPLPACFNLDDDDGDDLVDLDDPGCTGALDDDETDP